MKGWHGMLGKRDRELDGEIQSHIEMAAQERIDRGEPAEEARAAAMREFGNVLLVKDVTHEMWGWTWLERLMQDLRYALRQLRHSPGFAITAILTLALGIGANTAIFTLTYALLLRSLPIERPDRLVQLQVKSRNSIEPQHYHTSAFYEAVRQQQRVFSGICAWKGSLFTGEQSGDRRYLGAAIVNGDCFSTLGIHAVAGRLLTPGDDQSGAQAAVISYDWWEERFHRDPGVLGKRLVMIDFSSRLVPITIVGVLPKSFHSVTVGDAPAIFTPMGTERSSNSVNVLLFARLKNAVTAQQAEEQLDLVFRRWGESNGNPWVFDPKQNPHLRVVPSQVGYSPLGLSYKRPLMLLQGLAGILLLASCAYLGTLMSARSTARRREIALRAALGASRGRLVRQLLSESLLLALAGNVAGVFFA